MGNRRLNGKHYTYCGICDSDVGVTRRVFGRRAGEDEIYWVRQQHKDIKAGRPICGGSRLQVPDEVVFASDTNIKAGDRL